MPPPNSASAASPQPTNPSSTKPSPKKPSELVKNGGMTNYPSKPQKIKSLAHPFPLRRLNLSTSMLAIANRDMVHLFRGRKGSG